MLFSNPIFQSNTLFRQQSPHLELSNTLYQKRHFDENVGICYKNAIFFESYVV